MMSELKAVSLDSITEGLRNAVKPVKILWQADDTLAFVARGGLEQNKARDAEDQKQRERDERVEKEAALLRSQLSVQSSFSFLNHFRALHRYSLLSHFLCEWEMILCALSLGLRRRERPVARPVCRRCDSRRRRHLDQHERQ